MTDTATLVSRLRANAGELTSLLERSEAADTIEAQADEIARLREALGDLLRGSEAIARYHGIDIDAECAAYQDSPFAKARAALKDTQP
jgi:NTP pyrophosphatase (non-canonical NTP hydrolase)